MKYLKVKSEEPEVSEKPKVPERWTQLAWQAMHKYELNTKIEVELDGHWHWHPGKAVELSHRRYIIIYFRNVGDKRRVLIDKDLMEKLVGFAEWQWANDDNTNKRKEVSTLKWTSKDRRKPKNVPINCRFVYFQLEKGEVLPSTSTSHTPGGQGFQDAFTIQLNGKFLEY
jgi:hypothetical protein